jgi:hypothetical protein
VKAPVWLTTSIASQQVILGVLASTFCLVLLHARLFELFQFQANPLSDEGQLESKD